jgi:tetratricopeptide (TPR) repeat protein
MKAAIRANTGYGMMFLVLLTMACASGYSKPANDYYEEGLLFYDRMEYARSVESFTRVLELSPHGKDNHLVYFNRGMAYFRDRRFERAIYDYTKALESSPAGDTDFRFSALEARANAYHNARRYDAAIDDISRALDLSPRHERAKYLYNNRAWAWIGKENDDAALTDFDLALSLDPDFDLAYFGRATVWKEKRDYQRALIDIKEAVKRNPSSKKYDDLLFEIKSAMNE